MKKKVLAGTMLLALVAVALPALGADPALDLPARPMANPTTAFLLEILTLLTFYLHLLLVNVLLGSAIVSLFSWKTVPQNLGGMPRDVSYLPKVLAMAVNLGVAPFLFIQVLYSSFIYPTLVQMALWWLSIVIIAIMAYYGLYVLTSNTDRPRAWGRPLLAVTVVLLLGIAFLLTTMSSLLVRPDYWFAWFDKPSGTLLNLGDPTFVWRFLHNIVGMISVGGLVFAFRGWWSSRNPQADQATARDKIQQGLRWFTGATLCQVVIGPLYLFSLPAEVRGLFLGGNAAATGALVLALLGMALSLLLIWQRKIWQATAASAGIIFLMVCIRDLARRAMLEPYTLHGAASTEALAMPHGQTSALVFFLLCAALAVAAVAYMAVLVYRTFFKPADERREEA